MDYSGMSFHCVSPEEALLTVRALILPHRLVLCHQVGLQVLPLGEGLITATTCELLQHHPTNMCLWLLFARLLFASLSMNFYDVSLHVVIREVPLIAVLANKIPLTTVNHSLVIFEILASEEFLIAAGTLLQLEVDVSIFNVKIEVALPEEPLVALNADEVSLFQMNLPDVNL